MNLKLRLLVGLPLLADLSRELRSLLLAESENLLQQAFHLLGLKSLQEALDSRSVTQFKSRGEKHLILLAVAKVLLHVVEQPVLSRDLVVALKMVEQLARPQPRVVCRRV